MAELILVSAMIEELLTLMPAHYACVMLYLIAKARESGQNCTPVGLDTLASITGLTRHALKRCIKRLQEIGFIRLETDKYRTLIHISSIIEFENDFPQALRYRSNGVQKEPDFGEDKKPPETATPLPPETLPGSPSIPPSPSIISLSTPTPTSTPTATPTSTTTSTPRFNFIKPSPEEVAAYAITIGFKLDGNSFCDFYESKGWVVGRAPMKNWKAAVRTWKKVAGPQELIIPKPPPKPREPEPEPDMSFEEMQEIRRRNMRQKNAPKPPTEDVVLAEEVIDEETIPASDVNDLVVKLAGGARRMP